METCTFYTKNVFYYNIRSQRSIVINISKEGQLKCPPNRIPGRNSHNFHIGYGFEVSAFLNLDTNFMKFRKTSFTMFHEVS